MKNKYCKWREWVPTEYTNLMHWLTYFKTECGRISSVNYRDAMENKKTQCRSCGRGSLLFNVDGYLHLDKDADVAALQEDGLICERKVLMSEEYVEVRLPEKE